MTGHRRRWGFVMGAAHLLALSCAPYLSNTRPEVRTLPYAWQCPTPSPIPTVLLGYDEAYGGEPPPTPTTYAEHPIYSTPVPTATPYVRSGSDYYAGQRVRVGPLIVAAQPSGDRGVRVTLENPTNMPVELHLGLSVVRTARRDDGRLVEGAWSPAEDGPGMLDPGTTTSVELSFPTIVGAPQQWGMPFVGDDQRRIGQTGNGYAWWVFRSDPYCGDLAGGPPSDASNAPGPAGVPGFGRVGWPVPPDTVISRGYGCHPFWTGVRGAGCPANAPWWHNGIDFANAAGTAVYAVTALRITYAGNASDCAGTFIRAEDREGYRYDYYHLLGFEPGIAAGASVAAGAPIARMGSTGCSTGAHLHLTVHAPDGRELNPFNVLEP